MPVQTITRNGYIHYPDGVKAEIALKGASPTFVDLGVLDGDVTNSIEWSEKSYKSANAGELDKRATDFKVSGKLTFVDVSPEALAIIGCGLFTAETVTAGTGVNAGKALYAGTSSKTLTPYQLKFTHKDDDGKTYGLHLFSVTTKSGLPWNFKAATSDGVNVVELSYEATIDASLDDGKQLLKLWLDDNAE